MAATDIGKAPPWRAESPSAAGVRTWRAAPGTSSRTIPSAEIDISTGEIARRKANRGASGGGRNLARRSSELRLRQKDEACRVAARSWVASTASATQATHTQNTIAAGRSEVSRIASPPAITGSDRPT